MEINELFNLKDSKIPSKKVVGEDNVLKHILMRIGILGAVVALLFIGAAIIDDDYVLIGAVLLSAGLTVILMIFLLIESLVLFSRQRKKLGNINLIMLGFFIFIAAITFLSSM